MTVLLIIIAFPPIFWAFGFKFSIRDLVAVVSDELVFAPGPIGTFIVAIALLGFAGVSLALGYSGKAPARYLPFLKYRVKEERVETMGVGELEQSEKVLQELRDTNMIEQTDGSGQK